MRSHTFSQLTLLLCCATQAVAATDVEEDNFNVNAGLNHTWDSNYNREPGSSSEQITRGSVGAAYNKTFSRQTLSASVGAARYRHKRRDFLDASLYRGGLGWNGFIGSRLKFDLGWDYRDRLAERIDFVGKDIINRDEKRATLKYQVYTGWALVGGVRDAEQTHSNDDRESLDYEEQDYNAGIQFQSGRGSTVTLRYTDGERNYLNQESGGLPEVDENLDYDYQRVAFETEWQMTGKTMLTGNIGYFNRDGEVNTDSGLETSIQTDWQATEKTAFMFLYGYEQPAVGEDSTNPSEVNRVALSMTWDWTAKITLETGVRAAFQEFDDSFGRTPRDEELYSWTPLILDYAFTDTISVRFNSNWQQRDSPIDDRNYTARIFSLGLVGNF
ncbi:hypothetical protein RE428_05450 [Marinobacter nanhaiticus D15-8W]|uniref:DUF481 domain-containing protein n=1 Tax=Marinobacter nanhaiticus D15-8W TaxID=626887 RepID=N6W3S9_9GAMM|nr:hypothetical protein [Marinobacter nanhaiticus]ENO14784.1 hypothetical protein J057_05516 [Marinobacter nanhaiticus D15-8W]BES69527.1 hypothetical protein RE428_05450 [Marinobacter nanhaiticus D15-8W]